MNHPEVLPQSLDKKIIFHSLSGELGVNVGSEDGLMLMDFPSDPPGPLESETTAKQVASAIGVSEADIVKVEVSPHNQYAIIEVAPSIDVAGLVVDSVALV
jgi:predicted PhzF superfamily epimerase YddE/YHI9